MAERVYNYCMAGMHSMDQIRREIERGYTARQQGQEGRARVCARRGAGEAARVYLAQHGVDVTNRTAYDLLLELADTASVGEAVRQAARRLVDRVDESYQLPAEVDLLQDAKLIASAFNVWNDDENVADQEMQP